MAHITADRIQESTTTTGTGTLTLAGAVTNFKTFSSAMATSDTCWYAIVDNTNNAWETGLGTLASSTTLARTTVIASSTGSAVSLAAGTKQVFMTALGTKNVSLDNTDAIQLPGVSSEPAAPSTGNLRLYSKQVANRMVLKAVGPSGVDSPLQNAFWQNNIVMWNPTTATAGVWLGTAGAGAGTYSTALPTTTSLYTAIKRGRWANVVTTTNQVLGQRNTEAMYFLGNAAGQGGFMFYARMGFDVWTNGSRFFGGMHSATTVISANPSALNNTVGFCVDDTDNGAISFLTRSTSATKASTGYTIVSGKGYDLYMFVSPNSSSIGWRIDDINAGTTVSGTATATTPAVNTMLTAGVLASNAALTTATQTQLGLNRIYVETDK